MPRYIDADKLRIKILGLTIAGPHVATYLDAVLYQINSSIPADVQEVRRGKYKYHDTPTGKIPYCSECGRSFKDHVNYCSNCGAKMEKE